MHLAIEPALLTQVKASLFADFRERNRTEQPPQPFGVGQLKFADLGATKECATGRLHDIFGTDPAPNAAGQMLLGEPFERFAITLTELADHRTISAPQPIDHSQPLLI